jgi:CD36 family.
MLTGESNILDLGKIVRWNYSNRTNYYGSCGLVNGTNGDLWFPPYDAEKVTVFSSDLCT